jgi:DNA-binding NarL/FixJ family response regulator
MASASLEILLVDDQLGVRRGLELLLRDAGFRIAGLAGSTEEAAALLRRRRHDAALVDSFLEGVPSAPLVADMLGERPDAPLVVYAGRDEAALAAAADLSVPGLVLRSSPAATLLKALRVVASGGTFTDPELTVRLPPTPRRAARTGVALLSPREREILGLLAEGWSGAEIAQQLYLSSETVRTHVRNAVQKLGARTRTQAVALVVGAGASGPRAPAARIDPSGDGR